MIASSRIPDTIARYRRTLREEVDRLAALVDDLFELSRTQAGVLRLQYERVSLGDLVSDAIAGSRRSPRRRVCKLEGRMIGPPPELDGVRARGAARAPQPARERDPAHSERRQRGRRSRDRRASSPSTSTSRCGTPAAAYPRRICRTSSMSRSNGDPRAHAGNGSGLGLAIAKGFVEAHSGELTVVNANGGARFTLRLPARCALMRVLVTGGPGSSARTSSSSSSQTTTRSSCSIRCTRPRTAAVPTISIRASSITGTT